MATSSSTTRMLIFLFASILLKPDSGTIFILQV
jgi:hypothetical protein